MRVRAKTIQRCSATWACRSSRKPKRQPKQLKLFEKGAPGDSIQIDVKVVKVKRDNGSEFPIAVKLAAEAAGIKHRYIKPRRPNGMGKSSVVTASTARRSGAVTNPICHCGRIVTGGLGAAVQPRTILDGAAWPHANGEAAHRATRCRAF